jgi:hypothetical protein
MAARWLKASKDRKSFRFVPIFAPLEDRTVPATYYVDPLVGSPAPGTLVTFDAGHVNEQMNRPYANVATGAPDGAAFSDLRTALDATELNAGPDTIVLATGVIPLNNSAVTFDLGGGNGFVNSIPVSGALTVTGDGAGATLVLPTANTQYDPDGPAPGGPIAPVDDDLTSLFRVDGVAASLTALNFRLDGGGKLLATAFAIQNGAAGKFDGVSVTGISFTPTGASIGTAIAGVQAASLDFANGTIANYGRIGIQFMATPGSVLNSVITGRGAGNFVNQGIEIDGGAAVTVAGNTITDNGGTAANSSGLAITDVDLLGGATPSTATVVGNTFNANTVAINIGVTIGTPDTSTLNAAYNNLVGNGFGARTNSVGVQDIRNNWWGDASGPFTTPAGTGKGDAIDDLVNLNTTPFLSYPTPRLVPNDLTSFANVQTSYLNQITTLNVAINPAGGVSSFTTPQPSVSFNVTFPVPVAANTVTPAPLRPTLNASDFNVTVAGSATPTTTTVTGSGSSYVITVSGLTGTNYTVTAAMAARAAIDPATGVLNAASNASTISVNLLNTAPTITPVPDQAVTAGGGSTAALPFTVGDAETAPAALTVTATSSNPAFVPTVGGSGTNRNVSVAAGTAGTATITLTVTDAGGLSSQTSFAVTAPAVVPPANTAPTITPVADQAVAAGGGSTAAIPFTVGDAETPAAALTVTPTSSNPALVPPANVVISGTGANRTVAVTTAPGVTGTSVITLTVTDAGGLTSQTSFAVTAPAVVPPANTAPTVSPVTDRTVPAGGSTGAIPFTVGDDTTAPAALNVTATSSNPSATAVVGGSGASRTVTVTGTAGAIGTSTITLIATDAQGLSTSTAFAVTFTNAAPTITGTLPNQTLLTTASTGPIAFTVGDDNTPAADLVVSAVSSNPAVVPESSITLGGAGAARTVSIGGLPGTAGTSTITLTVRDADGAFSERTFAVTVQAKTRLFAVAADAGSVPEVRVFGTDGMAKFTFLAFESSFTGGVRVATADFDGDGTDDIVVAAGPGGGSRIRVISGATGAELANFFAFEPAYRGGLNVAAGVINASGVPSIVVGADKGGGPRVSAFALNGTVQQNFFAFDPAFRGGANVAVGDVNKDGLGDIVVGAGAGGGPRVTAYSLATGAPTVIQNYFAFDPTFKGGVFVSAGTFGIAAAQGINGNNEVRVQNGAKVVVFETTVTGGTRLGTYDFAGDGTDEILVAAGPGGGSRIQGYTGGGTQILNEFAFDTVSRTGYFIG